MEPLLRPRRILATKISYISQIMVYFGYIHEWAELYRQLWRDSREEWNSKSQAIFKVIMRNKNSRFRMLIMKPFTNKNADFLLRNGIYNYCNTLCHSPYKSTFWIFSIGENDNGQYFWKIIVKIVLDFIKIK